MTENVRVHAVVHGKVQGVGFRAFTQYHATQQGLTGWVRNLEDGTVEVEAEGIKAALDVFLQHLKQGPTFSQVTQVVVDWKDSTRQTQQFTIRRDLN